jgi:uncharacterized protein (DUF58 family)
MADSLDRTLFDGAFIARLERLRLAMGGLSVRLSGGPRRSRRLGDGLEFADHRDYAAGDDVRFLDWAVYARMERLLVRLFHEHSQGQLELLLDASASMAAAPSGSARAFDWARRACAALAYVAVAAGDSVTITPIQSSRPAGHVAPRDRAQFARTLEYLSSLSAEGKTDLVETVARRLADRRRPQLAVIVSDLHDCELALAETLGQLSRRSCGAAVVHVIDPTSAAPALEGPLELVDAERGRSVQLTATDELLTAYRQAYQQWRSRMERTCRSRGAVYAPAWTDRPIEQLLLDTLRRAGVVEG